MQWNKFLEPTLWAMWGLVVGGAGLWVVVGSIGYFSKTGWLPKEASGWVQAIGALLSILAAWFIATAQSRRAVRDARLRDDARCVALSEMIKYAESVFHSHKNMSNDMEKIARFQSDLSRARSMLDGIDLYSLPDAELIEAVCVSRQVLDDADIKFRDIRSVHSHGIYFWHGTAKLALAQLSTQREACIKVSLRNR